MLDQQLTTEHRWFDMIQAQKPAPKGTASLVDWTKATVKFIGTKKENYPAFF